MPAGTLYGTATLRNVVSWDFGVDHIDPDEAPRCIRTKQDGTPCKAFAVSGEDHCTFHKPKVAPNAVDGQ